MVWTPPDQRSEANPDGKNSTELLNAIKRWEMELPNMVLLVHGGCSHPLQLVQGGATTQVIVRLIALQLPRLSPAYRACNMCMRM